ncbi:MAG: helix-turn-helix domain-containing protein [[Eubacterium] siraeum]|jgi:biotin operon repressor
MYEFFMNDKYKVLQCMASRQISVNNQLVIKLSQQEIADILHFTKTKVNTIISELKTNGYIIQLSTRGKYSLTDKANSELKKISNQEVMQ